MLKPSGYSIVTEPGKRNLEHDTFTCAHCRAITFTRGGIGQPLVVVVIGNDGKIRTEEVRRCFNCYEYICPRKECDVCVPALKKIEEEELESYRKQQRKLVGG